MLANRTQVFRNIFFAYASLFYLGLTDNLRGPLYPEILNSFQISSARGSWFFSVSSTMALVGGFSVTLLLSRFGYLGAYRISVAVMTLSQLCFALAQDFSRFLLGAGCLGFSIGCLGVIQNVLVSVAATEENRSRFQSGLHANYAGASLLAPVLVATLALARVNFHFHFWITVVLGLGLFALSFQTEGFLTPTLTPRDREGEGFPLGPVLAYVFILSSYVLCEVLVSSRLAQFLRLHFGQSLEQSSLGTSVFFMGLFFGRILFAFVQVPLRLATQMKMSLFFSGLFVLGGLYLDPFFFALVGFAMGPFYPLSMALLSERFPTHLQAASTFCVIGSGLFLAGMHVVAGALTDRFGILSAMLLVPVFAIFAFGALHVTTLSGTGRTR